MGIFSKLFRKEPKNAKWADMLNGYIPLYSQFGNNIYASDVVQQAVYCIVTEMKKLNPMHIRAKENNDIEPVNSSIQKVLNNPNPLMTTSDFIEKIMWQLILNYNAFIIPTYYLDEQGNRVYTALTPIAPVTVEFIQDGKEQLYVKLFFRNGFTTTIKYDDIIHIRSHYSVNEFMGGNEYGQPDFAALLKTLDLNDALLKGVSKAMKSSCAINGIVKFKTLMDNGKTEKALKELEEKLANSESGFLPLDIASEFTPIDKKVALVDDKTLKFIDEKILRHFGVPLCIPEGDYTAEQYAAFYQKTLEPFVISISQAFTKSLFTPRQKSLGNKIQFYPKELIFMSMDQTLQMVTLLSNTGAIFENEKRHALGLQPLPELTGKRYQSLNWVSADIAAQYQVNGVNNDNRFKSGGGDHNDSTADEGE